MAQAVKFNDRMYNFPDNATKEQILGFLEQNASGSVGKPEPQPPEGDEPDVVTSPAIPLIPQVGMTASQATHRDVIARIETGGNIDQPFIRTGVAPKRKKQLDSTAYGPLQITRNLIRGYLKTKPKLFNADEKAAMNLLIERQKISLTIGGKFKRPAFERGGSERVFAEAQAEALGFDNADDFLDAFDYGGNLGLHEDKKFMVQYENFSRKMLNDVLKGAGGDGEKAAAMWHGGPKWATSSHAAQTKAYIKLYKKFREEMGESTARKGTPIPSLAKLD